MKNKLLILAVYLAAFSVLSLIFFGCSCKTFKSDEINNHTWQGYKKYFIDADGRVKRPIDGDTVSEGQAYAMLRAVWMDDKETFDRCYRWTEKELSRKNKTGDNLLAWHWKNGNVIDWMPASDADIDYALSLILAQERWGGEYKDKANLVMTDILRFETFTSKSGRLYLSPWVLEDRAGQEKFSLNPSYYSPAHFRVFYLCANDRRWLDLIDTTYYMLNSLSKSFNGEKGAGLIPDWCGVNAGDDTFYDLKDRSAEFGWEAVRVPFRVGLDLLWFDSKDARMFFQSGISDFIEKEWAKNMAVFCEYKYNGECVNKYESPLFYAAYYFVFLSGHSKYRNEFLSKTRKYLKKYGQDWVYQDKNEYYVNSLSWLAEGVESKIIKLFLKGAKND